MVTLTKGEQVISSAKKSARWILDLCAAVMATHTATNVT